MLPLTVRVKAWPPSRTISVNFFVRHTITHGHCTSGQSHVDRLGSVFKLSTSDDQHALFQCAASSALSASCAARVASRSSAQITSTSAPVCVGLLRAGQSKNRSKCNNNWVRFCRAVSCGSSKPGLRSSGRHLVWSLWSNTITSLAEAGLNLQALLTQLTVASTDINGI